LAQYKARCGRLSLAPCSGGRRGCNRRSIKRALDQGISFRTLATTLADTLEWFKTLPAERQAKLKAGFSPERERGVLELWKKKD
jgi:2'-hydroxyisoflavone reductase